MATKATRSHLYGHKLGYRVEAGEGTVTANRAVIFGSDDVSVLNGGASDSDLIIGIALNDAVEEGSSDNEKPLEVNVLFPGPIQPMKLAGTVARGQRVITDASGNVLAAGAIVAGGGTIQTTIGFAVQSGDADDLVGICLVPGVREVA